MKRHVRTSYHGETKPLRFVGGPCVFALHACMFMRVGVKVNILSPVFFAFEVSSHAEIVFVSPGKTTK